MGKPFGNLPAPCDGAMLVSDFGNPGAARRALRRACREPLDQWRAARSAWTPPAAPTATAPPRRTGPKCAKIEAIGRALTFAEWTGARLQHRPPTAPPIRSAYDNSGQITDAAAKGIWDVTSCRRRRAP